MYVLIESRLLTGYLCADYLHFACPHLYRSAVREYIESLPEVKFFPSENRGCPFSFSISVVIRFHNLCRAGHVFNEVYDTMECTIVMQDDLSRVADVQVDHCPFFKIDVLFVRPYSG
jgi:hypothetical protein